MLPEKTSNSILYHKQSKQLSLNVYSAPPCILWCQWDEISELCKQEVGNTGMKKNNKVVDQNGMELLWNFGKTQIPSSRVHINLSSRKLNQIS